MKMLLHVGLAVAIGLTLARTTAAAPAAPAGATSSTQPACVAGSTPVTAILSALQEETSLLEQSLAHKQEQKILGIRFVSGTMGGRQVVLVVSGMGKVNAAVVTTLLVEHFAPGRSSSPGLRAV